MKKVGIALILLAAVAAVSYLTAVRNQSRAKAQYREGYSRGAAEAQAARHQVDSLSALAAASQTALRDSLKALQMVRLAERDSLTNQLAARDQQLVQLRDRAKAASTKSKSARKEATASNLKHSQILDFYKRKLAGLPKDLSDYERTVALTEIRDETIKKFSITSAELDRIRMDGKATD